MTVRPDCPITLEFCSNKCAWYNKVLGQCYVVILAQALKDGLKK